MRQRVPGMSEPQDSLVAVDVEAALLGAMLLENTLVDEFADRLGVKDFHEALHGRIYSAMLKFRSNGRTASPITLRPVFQNDVAALGGDYLAKLADTTALVVGAEDFASQLIMLAQRRRARDAGKAALERLEKDFEASVPEIVGPIHDVAVASTGVEEVPTRTAGGMIGVMLERARRIRDGEATIGARNALIPELDEVMGPLEAGIYAILAGRPSMGKSGTGGSAALGYAMNGHGTLLIQGEMSEDQQAMRVASDASLAFGRGIPAKVIRRNQLDAGHINWLGRVQQKLDILPLRYKATGRRTIRQIEAMIAREKALMDAAGQKLEVVVLDQLSFIDATDEDGRLIEDDRKRMNAVSAAIPTIAKRLGLAILALAQVSRNVEARVNKRPQMSDLKETGKLEEDADVIVFVYREEWYLAFQRPTGSKSAKGEMTIEDWEAEMAKAKGKIELIGGKARHDQLLTRTVNFQSKYVAVRGLLYDPPADPDIPSFEFEGHEQ